MDSVSALSEQVSTFLPVAILVRHSRAQCRVHAGLRQGRAGRGGPAWSSRFLYPILCSPRAVRPRLGPTRTHPTSPRHARPVPVPPCPGCRRAHGRPGWVCVQRSRARRNQNQSANWSQLLKPGSWCQAPVARLLEPRHSSVSKTGGSAPKADRRINVSKEEEKVAPQRDEARHGTSRATPQRTIPPFQRIWTSRNLSNDKDVY